MRLLNFENIDASQQNQVFQDGYKILKFSAIFIEKIISFLPSKLVVITGVSCSGKSEISNGLTTRNKDIIHIDADEVARETCMQLIKEKNTLLFNQIFTVVGMDLAYYAIFYSADEFFSKRNIASNALLTQDIMLLRKYLLENPKWVEELNRKITYALLNKIKQYMLFGKIVVLDLVATGESLRPFSIFSPLIITLYKPFEQLKHQMDMRNQKAIKENKPLNFRNPAFVLPQISTFFSSLDRRACLPKLRTSTKANVLINADHLKVTDLVKIVQNIIDHQSEYEKLKSKSEYIVVDKQNINPKLIIFDGLSTAGKTTTAEAYMSLHPTTVLLHRSERQRKILLTKIPTVLRNENPKADSIFCYAKYKNNVGFNTLFTNRNGLRTGYIESIDRICRNKQNEIFSLEEKDAALKAKQFLNAGITVILDNLIFKDNLNEFNESSPIVVLVYCPLENILKHLKQRVEESIKRDRPLKWRDPYNIYRSYTKLFGPKNVFSCKECLETINRDQVMGILENLFKNFNPTVYGVDKNAFTQEILTSLGLDKLNFVPIYPLLTKPDLVLNTKNSAYQNGIILTSYLNSQEHHVTSEVSLKC